MHNRRQTTHRDTVSLPTSLVTFSRTSREVGRMVGTIHREEVEITDCKDREEDLETQDQGSIVRCVV
jgi:hypothetical protein